MSIHGVPRLPPGLVDRPVLSERLEAQTPLVVLHAPAGYGKTVALTQWARRTSRTGVWMRVRNGNAEPTGFAQQLSANLDDAGLLDDDNPLRTAAETLLVTDDPWPLLQRGLRRMAGGGVTLIIDESERLSDDTVDGILNLIADLPTLAVRATTRTANRFTESGLELAFDVDRIGVADLELTPAEVAAVLGDDERSARVGEVMRIGAAPAVARVIALAGSRDGAEPAAAVDAAIESWLRLRRAASDERFRSFIERVSLTEAIDASFAAELTGEVDAAALLDRAEGEGLGYWRNGASGATEPLFTLSPVFRRVIERRARASLLPATVHDVDVRIARWSLERGRPFDALRIAVAWQEWDLASEVVRRHWNDMLRLGGEITRLFAPVPLVTLRKYPLLAILLAIRANSVGTQRLRAVEYFALAAYGARTQRARSRPADRALLRAIETAAQRVSGRGDAGVASAVDGLDVMRQMSPDERDRVGVNEPTVYNQLGTTLFYSGRTDDALECFRAALASGDARGLRSGLQGLALLGGALAVSGDMPEAAEAVAEAERRSWPSAWIDGYPGSFYQVARAFLALENDDPDAAAAALATLDPHRATIEHWAILEHVDAMIALLRGQPDAALVKLDTTLRAQRSRHALHPLMVARLRHTRAVIELARGDVAASEQALGKGADNPRRSVSRARIALAQGDVDRALRLLAAVPGPDAAGRTMLSARVEAERQALLAASLALVDGADADDASPPATAAHAALRQLGHYLDDRGQALALMLTPAAGVDAMIRLTAQNGSSPGLTQRLERARDRGVIGGGQVRPRLTGRELAVAQELVRSESVAQIAEAMSVSPNTVKSQLRAIYRKLGVRSREEALQALVASGLTSRPELH